MGSMHSWKTPRFPVDDKLVFEVAKVVIDHVNECPLDRWQASIADIIVGTGRPASQIDDWYGTFLAALDNAKSRGFIDFKSAGPKGRWYRADATMQANFLAAVAETTGSDLPKGAFSNETTVTISCPHCGKPHNYNFAVTVSQ